MKPRGDFQCLICQEVYELPLGAAACPDTACGGLLERRFTTAPAVLRGADQGREAVTQRLVERAAADEFNAQAPIKSPIPENHRSRAMPISVNAIPGDARQGSRQFSAPVIAKLMGRDPRAFSDYKPKPT